MTKQKFSDEFKSNAVKLAQSRGNRSLNEIATELNISISSLYQWLKQSKEQLGTLSGDAKQWSPSEKLLALEESYSLSGEALSQWCRMKGLFEHQLNVWRKEFIACFGHKPEKSTATEVKSLKQAVKQLEADLQRKNLALAESAALLVLSKKYQALISEEGN